MEKETKNTLTKWIMLVLLSALVCLLLFEIGSINEKSKHLKDPDVIFDSVVVKDQTETKKLRLLNDSLVIENKRLEAIIKRKQSNVSQILMQNEITKTITPEFPDTIAYHFNDSVRARYREMFIEGRDRH
jgi:hypothetical protein